MIPLKIVFVHLVQHPKHKNCTQLFSDRSRENFITQSPNLDAILSLFEVAAKQKSCNYF